jgi:hypothetical protein
MTKSLVLWEDKVGAELGGGCFDVALPVLAGEHRAATLTPPMRDTPMGWSMGDARL